MAKSRSPKVQKRESAKRREPASDRIEVPIDLVAQQAAIKKQAAHSVREAEEISMAYEAELRENALAERERAGQLPGGVAAERMSPGPSVRHCRRCGARFPFQRCSCPGEG
jgi:hypothetical protein